MKKSEITLLCVVLLTLGNIRVTAQTKPADLPSSLITIYTNLGPRPNWFNCHAGLRVSQIAPIEEWAMPFTPQGDYLLVEVQVALTWVSGFNKATVSIYTDQGGLPGTSIRDYPLSNLPKFGVSCYLDNLKFSPGVKLQKGKQYWVVAKAANLSNDKWNLTYNGANGTIARKLGTAGWTVNNSAPLGALAVLAVSIP